MIRIAIVEDETAAVITLQKYLLQYQKRSDELFQITVYNSAIDFLERYRGFEIVMMDIHMPHMNGMEAAVRLRKMDSQCVLIFVTYMTQYAVKGYEVDATDFIIKPVSYYNFAMKFEKALRVCRRRKASSISIASGGVLHIIDANDLYFVEVENHDLVFHTRQRCLRMWGNLGKIEQQMAGKGFSRCSASHLVNLAYVTSVRRDIVVVHGNELRMTRTKKKAFLKDLADYLGG